MKAIDLLTLKGFLEHPSFDTLILDVRTDEEFKEMRLAAAKHIPIQEIRLRLSEITPYSIVIVHCAHGNRARKSAEFLEKAHPFKEVYYVAGDIEDWEEADLNVARG